MPIWEIRTVVTKTSIKQIPWSVSIQIHTEFFLLQTLIGNMTHNLHSKKWGVCPPVHLSILWSMPMVRV